MEEVELNAEAYFNSTKVQFGATPLSNRFAPIAISIPLRYNLESM